MRLLYITNVRLPNNKGHGVQIAKMAEAFTKLLKDNFALAIPDRAQPPGLPVSSVEAEYALSQPLQIKKLPIFDPMILSRHAPESFERFFFTGQTLIFGFSALFFCLKNKSLLEVIYTRDFYLLPFLLLAGKPVYYEAHFFPSNRLAILIHKVLIPQLAGVVLITTHFKNFFDKYGFKYKKSLVSPDATDIDFFTSVKKKDRRGITVGYIGNLQGLGEDKGGSILLSAFEKVHKKYPRTNLLIVGDGDIKTDLDGVTFTGRVDYCKIPGYFSLIDIGVIPFPDRPHFRYFMSPLKLFDYLASGKPIVTSDLPSLREVISEKNAVFTQPGNAASLAEGIIGLLTDHEKRINLGHNNRLLAGKLTWEARAGRILSFIDNTR